MLSVLLIKHHSGDQVKKNKIGWDRSKHGVRRSAYRILVVKPEGRNPLGTPRCRWEDNIKLDLR